MSELGREIEACLKPLSDKERAFAKQYALVPNSKAAAVQAGYSEKVSQCPRLPDAQKAQDQAGY